MFGRHLVDGMSYRIEIPVVSGDLPAIFQQDRQGFANIVVMGLQDMGNEAGRAPAAVVQGFRGRAQYSGVEGGSKFTFGDTRLFCGLGEGLTTAAAIVDAIFLKYF